MMSQIAAAAGPEHRRAVGAVGVAIAVGAVAVGITLQFISSDGEGSRCAGRAVHAAPPAAEAVCAVHAASNAELW